MLDLDFDQDGPQVITHEQYNLEGKRILRELKDHQLRNHVILFSSGTTGYYLKGYALSFEALKANARAVNEHFKLEKKDVWALSLPVYHVGGLSVLVRAKILGNNIIDCRKLDPVKWRESMSEATISTIVPTQLHDLVSLGLEAPSKLKYLIVGGDLLSSELKLRAMELGWPVVRTYGMTEVGSQLASASKSDSDIMKILPLHKTKTNKENRLLVKSPSLFTLEFQQKENLIIKKVEDLCDDEGYYITNDRVEIKGNVIVPMGRFDTHIKISGHLVNFNQLRDSFYTFQFENGLSGKMEFVLEEDIRKGKKLVLLHLKNVMNAKILEAVHALIYPVKVDEVREVKAFNKTELGKLIF